MLTPHTRSHGRHPHTLTPKHSPSTRSLHQVIYDSSQFLEKNRDSLSRNVVELLKNPDNELVGIIFTHNEDAEHHRRMTTISRSSKTDANKLSVSANFKNSLLDLMDKMLAATPHFIRFVVVVGVVVVGVVVVVVVVVDCQMHQAQPAQGAWRV